MIGMSLGMTNAILKRLVLKGYLSIRKVNNRNIAYAVTPAGVEAIAKRSYRYLRRTIGSIVRYKEAIEGLVRKVRAWLRETIGIAYDPIRTGDQVISFTLFSENGRSAGKRFQGAGGVRCILRIPAAGSHRLNGPGKGSDYCITCIAVSTTKRTQSIALSESAAVYSSLGMKSMSP